MIPFEGGNTKLSIKIITKRRNKIEVHEFTGQMTSLNQGVSHNSDLIETTIRLLSTGEDTRKIAEYKRGSKEYENYIQNEVIDEL